MGFYFLKIIPWLEQHQLPCPFKLITHIDCPVCGFQRSGIALLKGNLIQSLELYPAFIPLLVLCASLLLNFRVRFDPKGKVLRMGGAFVFIIILVSYIYKLTN